MKKYGVVVIDKWLNSQQLELLKSDWEKIRELRNNLVNYISELGGKDIGYASYSKLKNLKNLRA